MSDTAIIYHFFPHYRRPVMEGLLALDDHRVVLVGDPDSTAHDPTIAAWVPADPQRFIATSCRVWRKKLVWQRGVLGIACSRRFDTVVFLASMNFLSTWLGAILARATGKRVLFWAHGWTSRPRGIKGFARRMYFSLAHGLLLYGRRARRIAEEQGFDPARLHVIYNSLDYPSQRAARLALGRDERDALRRELFGSADGAVVACTTRLVRLRRLDLLLEAVARLRAGGGPEVRVLLVGDGPERAALEAQATALGLQVHFAGACYDEARIARYLTAGTCTVAPGKVGLTAMHSLAFGVPVLTHGDDDDQMPESEAVVDGITGDRFKPNDIEDMARVIGRWVREPYPAPEVAAACIAAVERFYNPARQVELIAAALAGRPAAPVTGEGLQAAELQ